MLKCSIKTCTSVRTALTYSEFNTDSIFYYLLKVLTMVRTPPIKKIESYLHSGYVGVGVVMHNVCEPCSLDPFKGDDWVRQQGYCYLQAKDNTM